MDATAAALPVLVQDKGKTTKPQRPPLAWRLGVALAAVAMNVGNVLIVLLSTLLMDQLGRRPLLLLSIGGILSTT